MTQHSDRQLWINGAYRPARSGEFFDTHNPATGEIICRVALAGADDVDDAVDAAKAGLEQWRSQSGAARGRVLHRAAALLREHRDELARLESLDAGKPLAETPEADVDSAADCLEYFAGQASSLQGSISRWKAASSTPARNHWVFARVLAPGTTRYRSPPGNRHQPWPPGTP